MKETVEYTPGPWEVVYNDACTIIHPTGDRTYRYVATTDSQADRSTPIQLEDKQENEANARLISAAPDLLEACLSIVALMDGQGRNNLPIAAGMARAAIAKAGGL